MPHRLLLSLGLARGQAVEPGVGVVAGLAALVLAFWNLHVVFLLIAAGIAGGIDLLVGARRAHMLEKAAPAGTAIFKGEKLNEGAIGKATYLIAGFFVGMILDTLVTVFGTVIDVGFVAQFKSFTPITTAILFYRTTKELASIMRNIEQTPGGKDALLPILPAIIDKVRAGMSLEPLDKRWSDRQTPEDYLSTLSTEERLKLLATLQEEIKP